LYTTWYWKLGTNQTYHNLGNREISYEHCTITLTQFNVTSHLGSIKPPLTRDDLGTKLTSHFDLSCPSVSKGFFLAWGVFSDGLQAIDDGPGECGQTLRYILFLSLSTPHFYPLSAIVAGFSKLARISNLWLPLRHPNPKHRTYPLGWVYM